MSTDPTRAPERARQFRKRPVVIEAMQFDGTARAESAIEAWVGEPYASSDVGGPKIKTLEGDHYVSDGDWIIRGVKGEFYPCKPDIFAMTYEPVAAPRPDAGPERRLPPRDPLREEILARELWFQFYWPKNRRDGPQYDALYDKDRTSWLRVARHALSRLAAPAGGGGPDVIEAAQRLLEQERNEASGPDDPLRSVFPAEAVRELEWALNRAYAAAPAGEQRVLAAARAVLDDAVDTLRVFALMASAFDGMNENTVVAQVGVQSIRVGSFRDADDFFRRNRAALDALAAGDSEPKEVADVGSSHEHRGDGGDGGNHLDRGASGDEERRVAAAPVPEVSKGPSREWLTKMGDAEAECESVSAGVPEVSAPELPPGYHIAPKPDSFRYLLWRPGADDDHSLSCPSKIDAETSAWAHFGRAALARQRADERLLLDAVTVLEASDRLAPGWTGPTVDRLRARLAEGR